MTKVNKKKTASKAKTAGAQEKADVKTEANTNTTKKEKKTVSNQFTDRITYAADLILEQRFTDDEIRAKVDAKFPNYTGSPKNFTQKEMGRTRWMLRKDKLKTRILDNKETPYGRLFRHPETGKIVERDALPKKKRTAKRVKKEDDPLNNIAGIDVHDNEEKTAKKTAKKTTKKESKAETLKKKIKKAKK